MYHKFRSVFRYCHTKVVIKNLVCAVEYNIHTKVVIKNLVCTVEYNIQILTSLRKLNSRTGLTCQVTESTTNDTLLRRVGGDPFSCCWPNEANESVPSSLPKDSIEPILGCAVGFDSFMDSRRPGLEGTRESTIVHSSS